MIPDNKPHLVLHWTFDIPNYRLYIDISGDLTYEAHEGGTLGYTKTYQNKKSHITPFQWEETEKFWISENYGHIYGYFQPDSTRYKKHPTYSWNQLCINGFGPDGEYLDHMQRMQILLEGNDMSLVWYPDNADMFVTPDNGLTIYKRSLTRDVNYPKDIMDNGTYWPEWPQACLMQPRTKGVKMSSHNELKAAGAPQHIIDKCLAGNWSSPLNPELQEYYIYPDK